MVLTVAKGGTNRHPKISVAAPQSSSIAYSPKLGEKSLMLMELHVRDLVITCTGSTGNCMPQQIYETLCKLLERF